MGYPLINKEKLSKEINNSYKELSPNDTVITVSELQQYVSFTGLTSIIAGGIITEAATALAGSAQGQQFVEVLRKYGVGLSSQTVGVASATTATQAAPTNTYPSLTASTGSGILLFTIQKNKYDAGIALNSLQLTGKKFSSSTYGSATCGESYFSDPSAEFIIDSGITSSLYGKNVEVFANPYFIDTAFNTSSSDGALHVLGSAGVSGFLFNDEGVFGLVSSSANDINGYNPLSAFASVIDKINRAPKIPELNASNVITANTAVTVASFTSQVVMNTMNFACKTNPDELNFSLNPSAFTTTAEGGSASYGYNYIYRLPNTQNTNLTETTMGNTDVTFDGTGSAMTSTSQSSASTIGEFQAYVTGVGLYNDNNDLLAIGKLGQPLKKSNTIPTTFLISIDL
jgi:hypothetical protein|tara:strand:+ start:2182 stop:3381 length:1200 start_codon:yes stop_codon:yes gene_type:complete